MSLELVPVTPDDIAAMPLRERGELITRALVKSKEWLAVATKGTDPAPIVEFRQWAATVAEMTRQKGLASDIQLDALEMVRRAERAIAQAVRHGQDAGEILKTGETARRPGQPVNGVYTSPEPDRKPGPAEAAGVASRANLTHIYPLCDGTTDDEFDDAITEARAEKNLSRNNVRRKLRAVTDLRTRRPLSERSQQIQHLAEQGYSSRQISKAIGIRADWIRELARRDGIEIRADQVMARVRDVDPRHVINTTVNDLASSLEVTWSLLQPEDFDSLAPDDINEWVESLDRSIQQLRKLRKELCRVNTR